MYWILDDCPTGAPRPAAPACLKLRNFHAQIFMPDGRQLNMNGRLLLREGSPL